MFADPIFYDGIGGIIRTIVAATILYFVVIFAVRIFGKRSMSQMNNFDWIVTVAIGSLMASGVMLGNVTVLETVSAIYILLGLQWMLTKLMQRSKHLTKVIKSKPRLLLDRGVILEDAMAQERGTNEDLTAALRGSGLSRIEDAQWVILEADASLSVIPNTAPLHDANLLANVSGFEKVKIVANDSQRA